VAGCWEEARAKNEYDVEIAPRVAGCFRISRST
jgi:hypothetical protein